MKSYLFPFSWIGFPVFLSISGTGFSLESNIHSASVTIEIVLYKLYYGLVQHKPMLRAILIHVLTTPSSQK